MTEVEVVERAKHGMVGVAKEGDGGVVNMFVCPWCGRCIHFVSKNGEETKRYVMNDGDKFADHSGSASLFGFTVTMDVGVIGDNE